MAVRSRRQEGLPHGTHPSADFAKYNDQLKLVGELGIVSLGTSEASYSSETGHQTI